jgi:hypothetical protein
MNLSINYFKISVFSILSLLIIISKFNNTDEFKLVYNKANSKDTILTKNLLFVKKIFDQSKKTAFSYNSKATTYIKLLEFYLFQKYNKSIIEATEFTVNDFIVANLFLYEKVYDTLKISYNNFKGKIYWNFGEIVSSVYNPIFPKMFKKTLLRHIQYSPQNESLIYYLIQYYYINKSYRKCKILIRKLINQHDGKNPIINDIKTIIVMMLVNILTCDEKFGEALEYAIFNLERIKSHQKNDVMLVRAYFILGFGYSKLGDNVTNNEEKIRFYKLALSNFKISVENSENKNSIYNYYLARQYYELKMFNEADCLLNIEKIRQLIHNGAYSTVNHYTFALKALTLIALQEFDSAMSICDLILKCNPIHTFKYSLIIILKFYLMLLKVSNNTYEGHGKDTKILTKNIQEYVTIIYEGIDEEIKKLDNFITSFKKFTTDDNNVFKTDLNEVQKDIKNVIVYSDFSPYFNEEIKDQELRSSCKIYYNEKKNLENLKIELLKNFFILMGEFNKINLDSSIDVLLNEKFTQMIIQNPNEEDYILIVS